MNQFMIVDKVRIVRFHECNIGNPSCIRHRVVKSEAVVSTEHHIRHRVGRGTSGEGKGATRGGTPDLQIEVRHGFSPFCISGDDVYPRGTTQAGAGVTVTVRLVPLPPKTILPTERAACSKKSLRV